MTDVVHMSSDAPPHALGRFQKLVMASPPLANSLSRIEEPGRFIEQAIASAGANGIVLAADAMQAGLRPDPLGLARWTETAMTGSAWPRYGWLPTHVSAQNGQVYVEWTYFGDEPLTQSFFEDSIRRAMRRPFNRLFRYRMTLGDFLADAAMAKCLRPSGFIFHMSRCGSTLVSQMLAALPHNIALSEAAPIDAVVQLSRIWPDLPVGQLARILATMIAAYGRKRTGAERNYFIKLDSWHTLALPLFRRAFPGVPWIFLYRDPVEVLVSQMNQRGTQMVPDIVPPSLYGIDAADCSHDEDYCSRVLAKVCQATIDNLAGNGLLVDYRELPDAVWTTILPHFGVTCSEADRAIMSAAALQDAKAPSFAFAGDSMAKQQKATASVRSAAERHLHGIYHRLEELRSASR